MSITEQNTIVSETATTLTEKSLDFFASEC